MGLILAEIAGRFVVGIPLLWGFYIGHRYESLPHAGIDYGDDRPIGKSRVLSLECVIYTSDRARIEC